MPEETSFIEKNEALIEITLREEFKRAAKGMSDPRFDFLKRVIEENGGKYLEGHEVLNQMNVSLVKADLPNNKSLGWSDRIFARGVSWVFGAMSRFAEKHRDSIVLDEVYASVPEDKKDGLIRALQNDVLVKPMVLKVE